jgi:hypothetical protein
VVLDEAYDRMATLDFELPNGFVNHGPMACEALAVLGCEGEIEPWARWFAHTVAEGPAPVTVGSLAQFDWKDALGVYERLPEWLGYFEHAIADDGWSSVVGLWVPRLVPGMATALFHGAIRTAHAVRAVDAVDTTPRQGELARALAYWAARFRVGAPVQEVAAMEELVPAIAGAAADAAGHYVANPTIFNLHGVTGAMAFELLAAHLAAEDGLAALAQIRAEHMAMFAGTESATPVDDVRKWDEGLALVAAVSRDAHQVKLVEACRRGLALTDHAVFRAAAEQVSGRR